MNDVSDIGGYVNQTALVEDDGPGISDCAAQASLTGAEIVCESDGAITYYVLCSILEETKRDDHNQPFVPPQIIDKADKTINNIIKVTQPENILLL